jgi:hypothetical protein
VAFLPADALTQRNPTSTTPGEPGPDQLFPTVDQAVTALQHRS